jgi:hypothetical protein
LWKDGHRKFACSAEQVAPKADRTIRVPRATHMQNFFFSKLCIRSATVYRLNPPRPIGKRCARARFRRRFGVASTTRRHLCGLGWGKSGFGCDDVSYFTKEKNGLGGVDGLFAHQ